MPGVVAVLDIGETNVKLELFSAQRAFLCAKSWKPRALWRGPRKCGNWESGRWLDQTDRTRPRAKLVFDARGAEGEWRATSEGWVFGYSMNMTSAIAFGLARGLNARDEKGRPNRLISPRRSIAAWRRCAI